MNKHLIIIGGGSAATTAARKMTAAGGTATLIHQGLPLGGCCLHVGCVPSKVMIRAAEQVHHATRASFPGLTPKGMDQDQPALFKALRERIDSLRARNYENPLPALSGLRLIRGWGKLLSPTTVEVNGEEISGDAILLATGSRTDLSMVQDVPADRVLSNENLFSGDPLPRSVITLGGGYIAVEMMQMMQRMGTEVTALQRSGHLLSAQPGYLGETLGTLLKEEGVNLYCGTDVTAVRPGGDGVEVSFDHASGSQTVTAEKIFVARGRLGNSEKLGLDSIGLETDARGFLKVDSTLQTQCRGIYAAGDLLGTHMLVYTASAEAEQVVNHLLGQPVRLPDDASIPWVVFSDPQVAGVGRTAEEARAGGLPVEEAELPVNRWPRFSSLGLETGFLKLFRNPETDTLLGARAICPEAGDLMSECALILQHQLPLRGVANRLVPYLTLTEGIQRCAERFHN